MSKRSSLSSEAGSETDTGIKQLPRYAIPRILLLDIDPRAAEIMRIAGYNVASGSFGKPYRVEKSDVFTPVIVNGDLPKNFAEHDIVIIDLAVSEVLPQAQGVKATTPQKNDWWVSASLGVVDPRPRLMASVQADMGRILAHGGVIIIFASQRIQQELTLAHVGYRGLMKEKSLNFDNWSFLRLFRHINIEPDTGQEVIIAENSGSLTQCLRSFVHNVHFECTWVPRSSETESWFSLAKNKFDDDVASIVAISEGEKPQFVLLFPQIEDKPRFLLQLFQEALPDLAPHLFPDIEGAKWVQRLDYELPRILELKAEIHQIQAEAEKKVTAFKAAITAEREEMAFLHALLTDSGESLVTAVERALGLLGFESLVNVDEQMMQRAETISKREDLQIHDESPILLIEVKGISGLPKDTAALQVWKYVAPRMREWKRTDVKGLAIINHQRNMPALERDNVKPFRDDLITNAEQHEFGLITTWDLFRLVRSYLKYGWSPPSVKRLFYQNGRIEPVPSHYEFVGTIEKFWPAVSAVGVRVVGQGVALGDRIAFELTVEYEEQDLTSLQVDKEVVAKAITGQLAGIKTDLQKDQLKQGIRVFRVRSIDLE